MKKAILVVTMLTSSIFISCSSDDDNADPVVGKWQQIEISDGSDATACIFEETLEFTSDGRLVRTEFQSTSANETDNCDQETTTTFEWSFVATNTYEIRSGANITTVAIFVIDGRLTLRTSEIFIPENSEFSQITKTYKGI